MSPQAFKRLKNVDQDSENSTYRRSFSELAEQIAELIRSKEIDCRPYHSKDCEVFGRLSEEQQKHALVEAKIYLHFLQSSIEALGDARDELRAFEFHFQVVFPREVYKTLKTSDVIEIYSLDNIQVWRNLNFFKICSYTIEEIFCEDWPTRYTRDPKNQQECLDEVERLLDPSREACRTGKVSPHYAFETASVSQFVLWAHFHTFARSLKTPLRWPQIWLVASQVEVMGSRSEQGDPFAEKFKRQPLQKIEDSSPRL